MVAGLFDAIRAVAFRNYVSDAQSQSNQMVIIGSSLCSGVALASL